MMSVTEADHDAMTSRGIAVWQDAVMVARLIAIDPLGLGGVRLRSRACVARGIWVEYLTAIKPEPFPLIAIPLAADEDRIVGGLDLSATLRAGRKQMAVGLLERADQGAIVLKMAERRQGFVNTAICSAMDRRMVRVERDGLSADAPARFACIMFDEGDDEEEAAAEMLCDRVAFHLPLDAVTSRQLQGGQLQGARAWADGPKGEISLAELTGEDPEKTRLRIEAARSLLNDVLVPDDMIEGADKAAASYGVNSIRSLQFCIRTARALAALRGALEVNADDAAYACRLVLGPRAQPQPEHSPPEQEAQNEPASAPEPTNDRQETNDKDIENDNAGAVDLSDLQEMIISATVAGSVQLSFRPADMARLRNSAKTSGKAGRATQSAQEGRPIGAMKGDLRRGGKLDIAGTLKAAAPWQRLRSVGGEKKLRLLPTDFRIKRHQKKIGSAVIFVVDASGSAAAQRLNETKGAVEQLLHSCYSRRDVVSVIAVRGETANMLLPPSPSLVRARRALANLPGGGGTPLAAGLQMATRTALRQREEGRTPFVVVLTDGKANIDLEGKPGRGQAGADADRTAADLRQANIQTLFFDTSSRPSERARALAIGMGAAYHPLPYAESKRIVNAVQQMRAGAPPR